MNVRSIFSSPFKGEAGRGMGTKRTFRRRSSTCLPHPHPSPPRDGEGVDGSYDCPEVGAGAAARRPPALYTGGLIERENGHGP